MDDHIRQIMRTHIDTTLEALRKNQMQGFFVEDNTALERLLDELISDGESVSVGGSVTLTETGTLEYLKRRSIRYLDRYAPGLTPEETTELFRQALLCDTYVTSTNAITKAGELYNVDGRGNRVAAMTFGPKQVIVIAGVNKLVGDLEEAKQRVRDIAAPANAVRLSRETPCTKTGYCSDCRSPGRICSFYSVTGRQNVKDRIKVILLPDSFGY